MTRPGRTALVEQTALAAARVDRAAGVVRGVKVLGPTSRNRHDQDGAHSTAYTPECLRAALPLVEGAAVYADHPDRKEPHALRSAHDRLGELVNARLEEGGVFADLRLLTSHPLAARLFEAAESMPSAYGLSINGEAEDADVVEGVYTVRKIGHIRSVDLVSKPASTNGLFEGHTVTLRDYLTRLVPALDVVKRKRVKALLEADDAGMMDQDMPPPADDAAAGVEGTPDHEQALWDGMRAAMLAVIDGPDDAETKSKKVRQYLKAHEKLSADVGETDAAATTDTGGGEEVEEEEEDAVADDADKPGEDKPDKKDTKEGEELRLLRAEKKARQLCEAARVEADGTLLEALACLPETQQKQMIAREKTRQRRSRAPLTEGDQGGAADPSALDRVVDGKGFADLLRKRGVS